MDALFWLLLAFLIVFGLPIYLIVRVNGLAQTVTELRERLRLLETRVAAGSFAATGGFEIPQQITPRPTPPPRPQAPVWNIPTAPTASQTQQTSSAGTFPQPPAAAPTAPPPPAAKGPDLEALLGGDWLAKVGIVAMVLAAAFFLQYAFSAGWIGPAARVWIGIAGSAVLQGLGQVLHRKPRYRAYAQVVISGGIAILFLSIWAAYNLYHLIGPGLAFGVLVAAAVGASVLAVKNDSQLVAVLCVLGAVSTPVLIPTSRANPLPLYAYLVAVNVWVAVLLRLRPWHALTLAALAGTWMLFFAGSPLLLHNPFVSEGFALVFFAFALLAGSWALIDGRAESRQSLPLALLLILGGCAAFAAASAWLLGGESLLELPALLPVGCVVACVLVTLALRLPSAGENDGTARRLFGYLAALAVAALTLLLPSNFPRLLPAEVPLALGFALFQHGVLLAAALWMRGRSETQGAAPALVVAGNLTLGRLTVGILHGLSLWHVQAPVLWLPLFAWTNLLALWLARGEEEAERPLRTALYACTLLGAACAVLLSGSVVPADEALRTAALFGAEYLLLAGTWLALRKTARGIYPWAGLVVPVANAGIFFGLVHGYTEGIVLHGVSVPGAFALLLALGHAAVGAWLARFAPEDVLERLIQFAVGATLLASAAALQLHGSTITIAWAVEGALLLWIGLHVSDGRVRTYSLALLAIATARVLILDLSSGEAGAPLLFNAMMLAGAVVVAALGLSAALYSRHRDRLSELEAPVFGVLTMAANGVALLFISVDVWRWTGLHWGAGGHQSAQQLSLSLVWTAYALVAISLGIWRRTKMVRVFAMGLLYLAIAKVFLLDLAGLEQPFRIVSFFVLGLILLVVSLLYTRFEARMSGSDTDSRT